MIVDTQIFVGKRMVTKSSRVDLIDAGLCLQLCERRFVIFAVSASFGRRRTSPQSFTSDDVVSAVVGSAEQLARGVTLLIKIIVFRSWRIQLKSASASWFDRASFWSFALAAAS